MADLLRRGSRGTGVSELQAALNFHVRRPAIPLVPDGIFGPKTEARLREFQAKANIQVDGIAGNETFRRLYQVADGAIEAVVSRSGGTEAAGGSARRSPILSPRVSPFHPNSLPGLRRLPPGISFLPNPMTPPVRQTRFVSAPAFDLESRLIFSPLDKDQPFKLTLSPKINWPVFLPKPLKLEIEPGMSGSGGFTLDGKIKIPFKLVDTDRLELKPYFFAGAGVRQDGFSDLNAGAAASLKLKLFDLGRSGLSVGVEADGGAKYFYDVDKGTGKVKGILEGGLILEGHF
jgi:hypothetical protein